MPQRVLDQVCRIVSDVLGVPPEQVDAHASYQTISNWDSLNVIKLVMAIESEFKVSIEPDDAVNFTSVGSILKVLEQKGGVRANVSA